MIKRQSFKFIASLLIAGACLLPIQSHAQGVMRIAAVVNDDVISALDLAQRISLTIATSRMKDTRQVRQRLAPTILRTMIDERLKAQEGKRQGMAATDAEIKSGIANFAASQKIKPDGIDAYFNKIGVDKEIIEEQAIAEITWTKVLTRRSGDRIKVTDKEIDDIFAQIEANKGKPEYLYSEIFLPVETPADDASARQMSERLIAHIKNGSPFAALARDFSQSPSALQGGNLGWVQSGNMSAEIEARLNAIDEGGYSNPLRTASGYYILHLRKKRIAGAEENDEILDVAQAVFPLKATMADDLLNDKRTAARNLAHETQSCNDLVTRGQKIEGVDARRFSNVKLSTMSADVRKTLTPLSANQITTLEQTGRAMLVLMVCKRQPVAKVPEIAKKNRIKQSLRMEKIGREGRRLLQKLRRNAFVDIRL
ncbi:peptidylprolyl isomerase [Terasakiella sp. SH-1]|uniref:peptidylprolyl isomerase n=1 Tax=Terasakiella sp. SH-1 TaxID=2560057 RepID=UPI001073E16C|nr:peptidylprolyl isomerase [Terasakiella sp. SH-1]